MIEYKLTAKFICNTYNNGKLIKQSTKDSMPHIYYGATKEECINDAKKDGRYGKHYTKVFTEIEIKKAFIRKKSTRLMQKIYDLGFAWSRHDLYSEHCLAVLKNGVNDFYYPCTVKRAKEDGYIDFGKDEKSFFEYIGTGKYYNDNN